ncbi:MAG: hypothetical protein JNM43_20445 [Planctomycetaceae bacterium]|nr:hypothetical protein [Planctomycetaceae bacterium]
MKRILIAWVYHGAFGHLVEAIEAANNYKTANPDCSVSVILCKAGSSDLVRYCPWIDTSYQIDCDQNLEPQLRQIPSEWDHVVYPVRLGNRPELWYGANLLEANHRLQRHLRARLGSQYDDGKLISGCALPCAGHARIRMKLPDSSLAWASEFRDSKASPVISVLLNGSAPFSGFPSIRTWRALLCRIAEEFPDASFLLTGLSVKSRFGFRLAQSRNRQIEKLSRDVPRLKYCFDVGLEKQLALIASSDIFLAPHTGFSFLAPSLGTPWLALSGSYWGDCTAGDTPFYFSVPKCECYPCYGNRKSLCKLRDLVHIPVPCVNELLLSRYQDVAAGIRHLMDSGFDLQKSFETYRQLAIRQGVNVRELWRIGDYFSQKESLANASEAR